MRPFVEMSAGVGVPDIPKSVRAGLRGRVGDWVEEWIETSYPVIVRLSLERWGVACLEALEGGSTAVVLRVEREQRQFILKLFPQRPLFEDELLGWAMWSGGPMPTLEAYDTETCAILQEAVSPGITLEEHGDKSEGVAAARLLARMQSVSPAKSLRPLEHLVAERISWTDSVYRKARNVVPESVVDRSKVVGSELLGSTVRAVAVHGDFFAGNILHRGQDEWAVVDPQPALGDGAFDAGTFCYGFGRGAWVNSMSNLFSEVLEISQERIERWAGFVASINIVGRTVTEHASVAETDTTIKFLKGHPDYADCWT